MAKSNLLAMAILAFVVPGGCGLTFPPLSTCLGDYGQPPPQEQYDACEAIITRDSHKPSVWHGVFRVNQGIALMRLERWTEAERTLDEAASRLAMWPAKSLRSTRGVNGPQLRAIFARGVARERSGKLDLAKADFDLVRERAGTDVSVAAMEREFASFRLPSTQSNNLATP